MWTGCSVKIDLERKGFEMLLDIAMWDRNVINPRFAFECAFSFNSSILHVHQMDKDLTVGWSTLDLTLKVF